MPEKNELLAQDRAKEFFACIKKAENMLRAKEFDLKEAYKETPDSKNRERYEHFHDNYVVGYEEDGIKDFAKIIGSEEYSQLCKMTAFANLYGWFAGLYNEYSINVFDGCVDVIVALYKTMQGHPLWEQALHTDFGIVSGRYVDDEDGERHES